MHNNLTPRNSKSDFSLILHNCSHFLKSGVEQVLNLLRRSYDHVRVHFTNVASGKVIDMIKEAQNDGLEVSSAEIEIKIKIVIILETTSIKIIRAIYRLYDTYQVTAECTHHHLNIIADQVEDGFTQLKCVPPFRDDINQEMLWDGIREGVINQVL